MINITLDMNCIIDLEEDRAAAPYIRELILMQEDGRISLRIPAISASERRPDDKYARSFVEFRQKLAAAGLENVTILKPIAYWDVTFWDWCLWGDRLDPSMTDLERNIHEVLFPRVEFACGERVTKRWLNAKCDVLALWSHIYHGSGIFVTEDSNFHKQTKRPRLLALGAGEISKPDGVRSRLTNDADSAPS